MPWLRTTLPDFPDLYQNASVPLGMGAFFVFPKWWIQC